MINVISIYALQLGWYEAKKKRLSLNHAKMSLPQLVSNQSYTFIR
uniref:Uncharacterized protein n=1 Tax=Rhizophora mucronata TaxID=61149 RepID=A0A2P2NU54_RHIMU